MRRCGCVAAVLAASACSAPSESDPNGAEPQGPIARIRVVDTEGAPVAGMLPIATRRANAFDAPVVFGDKTDARGAGGVTLPRADRLWVRAWDPSLEWFALNVYEVMANVGDETEVMEIRMARSGSLRLHARYPGGDAVRQAKLGLRLTHPERGPWWHAETVTGPDGAAEFPRVPPGTFLIGVVLENGETAEWGSTRIQSGETVDLGEAELR